MLQLIKEVSSRELSVRSYFWPSRKGKSRIASISANLAVWWEVLCPAQGTHVLLTSLSNSAGSGREL